MKKKTLKFTKKKIQNGCVKPTTQHFNETEIKQQIFVSMITSLQRRNYKLMTSLEHKPAISKRDSRESVIFSQCIDFFINAFRENIYIFIRECSENYMSI